MSEAKQVKIDDLSTEQLKALCYDQICQKAAAERAIAALEQELARRAQAAQQTPATVQEPEGWKLTEDAKQPIAMRK